ncbi:MAG: leucyl aminopeptidase [bacterium]|nr:leucyl aminopeptidase [bacterium]
MHLSLSTSLRPAARGIVLALFQDAAPVKHPWFTALPAGVKQTILAFSKAKEFTGKIGEVHVIPFGSPVRRVVLLGLGEPKDWNRRKAMLASRQVVVVAKQHKITDVALRLDDLKFTNVDTESLAQLVAENAQLADYSFVRYRKVPKGGWPKLTSFVIHVRPSDRAAAAKGVRVGTIIGTANNAARDLANTPGSDMTPTLLANAAVAEGKKAGFTVTVMKKDAIEREGMGGLLGVSQGSPHPPTFTIMEYAAPGHAKDKPLVFVGKGVTFDSGGLNVKPDTAMYEMHMDMSGAAAVIAAMRAIALLQLPLRVIGLIPAAENMSAGDAYRPGDQLRTLSGKTIEVMHTDAEGRVILADALTYAERYKPAVVIDVATLTGAAMVALGQRAAAILSPNEALSQQLHTLAEESGDLAWPLPLWEEYEEDIKGTFGDVANSSKVRYGGAITGAAFLWQFAKKFKRWAHLDIAPTMTTIEGQYLAKGSAGAGVRLLVAFARNYDAA